MLCFDASGSEELEKFCVDRLGRLDLGIPTLAANGKTQIYAPADVAEFLGVELALANGKYEYVLAKSRWKKIRESFLTLGNISALRQLNLDVTKLEMR